jgi:tRNA pseudouridine55 synthase
MNYKISTGDEVLNVQSGILLVDKPANLTSFGVVARVRRVLSNKQGKRVKVGHTGTLDPFATGLMILVIGDECKNAGSYSKLDKVYEATITLGQTSTTGDPEGDIISHSDFKPSLTDVNSVVARFIGEIEQTPPIYSAIKIDGQRAYKMARAGKTIEMPVRKVQIYDLKILDYSYPLLKIRASVSSGTYIRTLAEDIGLVLKTGAYCSQLRRISIADWSVDNAQTLEQIGIIS